MVSEPLHAIAYSWRGESPGAGYHYTEVHAAEIDFVGHRIRTLRREARYPESMIGAPKSTPAELLASEWLPINAGLELAMRSEISDWLAGAPPTYCATHRPSGRESGSLVRFSLTTERGTWRVDVNPDTETHFTEDCSWVDYRRVIDLLLPPTGLEFERAR